MKTLFTFVLLFFLVSISAAQNNLGWVDQSDPNHQHDVPDSSRTPPVCLVGDPGCAAIPGQPLYDWHPTQDGGWVVTNLGSLDVSTSNLPDQLGPDGNPISPAPENAGPGPAPEAPDVGYTLDGGRSGPETPAKQTNAPTQLVPGRSVIESLGGPFVFHATGLGRIVNGNVSGPIPPGRAPETAPFCETCGQDIGHGWAIDFDRQIQEEVNKALYGSQYNSAQKKAVSSAINQSRGKSRSPQQTRKGTSTKGKLTGSNPSLSLGGPVQ